MTAPTDRRGEWTVVIPVKSPTVGKSRLEGSVASRADLARAIALDTIAAAVRADRVRRVVVVTDDASVAADASSIGGVTIVDEGGARGLDAAIDRGIRTAAGTPRAALLGDLPALRPADLDDALARAIAVARGLVPDADGTGSTLVTDRDGTSWSSAFGVDSARRHRDLGCRDLAVPLTSTLRHDVDTAAQLATAVDLGLGPRSRAVAQTLADAVAPESAA